MSRLVRVGPLAGIDVDHIFRWLAHRSVQGAVSWYVAFGRAVQNIQLSPENYGAAPEAQTLQCELRQAFFKTRRGRLYRIVFRLDETQITILRVRGPAQGPLRRRDLPGD